MGRKKLTMKEKSHALTLLEKGNSVFDVARDLAVSKKTIYQLKKSAILLPLGMVPQRKLGSGATKKTSSRTDKLLKREVMSNHSITAIELKSKYPELLHNVATRTIRHRLQKDLGLPSRRAVKKPLLTAAMKKKRLDFCKKYQDWTSEKWKKVMFNDENTFKLVRGDSKIVRRPNTTSRYDLTCTIKTVKQTDNVTVWGTFNRNKGTECPYFFPENLTMKVSNYVNVLQEHLPNFWVIHQCDFFMHDGTPAYKAVTKFLNDQNINILEWPDNSLDFNPIENVWNFLKNKVQETRPNNINELKEVAKTLWVTMDSTYFARLAESMPKRLEMVIQCKGDIIKY